MRKYTLGTDPEVFFKNKETGEFVPAIGLIPGTKEEPFKFKGDNGYNYTLQIDNVACEFTIPPCSTPEEMKLHIHYMLNHIKEKPNAKKTNTRSCGMHVHVGYEDIDMTKSIRIMKLMDVFWGLGSLQYDKDTQRRKLYGKSGEFRFQNWGAEYRVLSAYMMTDVDASVDWIFNTMDTIFNIIDNIDSKVIDMNLSSLEQHCSECINKRMDITGNIYGFIKQRFSELIIFNPNIDKIKVKPLKTTSEHV